MIAVISCSLRPSSHSRLMADEAVNAFAAMGQSVDYIDLRDWDLPSCDGVTDYSVTRVPELQDRIRVADAILFATPIYNYDVSSVLRNLCELTGDVWEGKIIGFLCAAGGSASYMAVMNMANSLMLHFRCLIIPRFVYAQSSHFADGKIADLEVCQRIDRLAHEIARVSSRLS